MIGTVTEAPSIVPWWRLNREKKKEEKRRQWSESEIRKFTQYLLKSVGLSVMFSHVDSFSRELACIPQDR